MKRFFLLLALGMVLFCCGCLAHKVPGKNVFYSTKSPALTIEFNGLEYLGEYRDKDGPVTAHTYFYADRSGGRGAWVEIINTREGWNVRPGRVPGKDLPDTGIYTRNIAGEKYFCRTFLVQPGSGKSGLAALPEYTAVRICTKLISTSKKISIGYAGEVDRGLVDKLFSSRNYGELAQEQKDFFAAFDKQADAALIMNRFQQGDEVQKIETPATIEKPWYRFTDFISLKQLIVKNSP